MATNEIKSGAITTFVVKVAGNAVPDELQIFSIYVEKKVNCIAQAKIVILDGDPNTGKFYASSSAFFLPGAEVSIEAGYDGTNKIIFKGIITGQSIRIDDAMGSTLEVICRDAAIKMTAGRKCLTYAQKKDSEIIESIIKTYSGLSAAVAATTTVYPQQVQYYATDWDFIITRAEANGLLVISRDGTISVAPMGANTNPVLTVEFGNNLYEFNADLNAVTQLGNVTASAWDYKNQVVNSAQASADYAGPGNLTTKKLSEVTGLSTYNLQTTAALEDAELVNWLKARLIKSEYSKIQGQAKVDGNNLLDPGLYITLKGLGDRFSGDHFISGVVHNFSNGNWFTDISVGLSSNWFIEEPDVMAPATSGLLPAARGLFNGTVKKIFDDPDAQYRILVDIPMFDDNGAGIWARLSNFYATSGAGAFFLPEVGDEVVVGFLNEDPRYPVILGSMYSSSNLKPYEGIDANEKNQFKAIVSKSGISIKFDDVDKTLTICTPDKNTMVFSDKDKQVSVTDENGNSLVMGANGISIKSAKDINIQSDQKINLQGTQGVHIQSPGGDIDIHGININETADVQYSAAGSATAKISSGAELTFHSAMIMIN